MLEGVIALLIAGFLGGQAPIILKFGLREFPPLLFTFLRFFIAAITLLPFFLKQKNHLNKQAIKTIVKNSIFLTGNVAIFSIAIQYTTAIASQILYGLVPIIVAILSHFVLGEKITKNKITGLFLAVFGISIIVYGSLKGSSMSFGTPLGNLLTIFALLSWSTYLVLSKKISKSYSPITISFINYTFTALILSFFVPFEHRVHPFIPAHLTIIGITSVLAIGILCSALMYFLIQIAIDRTSPFITSFFQYLGPPTAAITAIPLLGERLTAGLIVGGILIFVGVFYTTTYGYIKK